MTRQYNCPACDQLTGVDIVYGEPSIGLAKQAELGEIVLGGCVIEPNQPFYHCKACGFEWDKSAHFENAKKIWLRDYVKGRSWAEMMDDNDSKKVEMDDEYLARWGKGKKPEA